MTTIHEKPVWADKVDALLETRGSNRKWLARRIRISETLLSRQMAGTRTLQPEHADRICEVLEVPRSFIFD